MFKKIVRSKGLGAVGGQAPCLDSNPISVTFLLVSHCKVIMRRVATTRAC